jgi:hypothetical protein
MWATVQVTYPIEYSSGTAADGLVRSTSEAAQPGEENLFGIEVLGAEGATPSAASLTTRGS